MTERVFHRVCIYGAGAIGGWIGTRLAGAGCQVNVVARGATLDALKRHGLRTQHGHVEATAAVHASADPAELGVQDLVVLAIKAPGMLEVARKIGPLIGPRTVVLTAMNGVPWWFLQGLGGAHAGQRLHSVDPGGEIGAALPTEQVIGCVVHAACSLRLPGFVQHHFGNRLIIGEPSGGHSERVGQLAALLSRAGFEAVVSEQIQRDIWFKLWGNMTMNPISALTGATTDLILGDELVRAFVSRVMLEAKEIGARLGLPIEQQPEDRHALTLKLGAFKTSMLQDVEAGKAVELDALVTVVKELGQLTGVPTPNTDTLLGLARLQARSRGLY
jgi:2-dehydropantoate 2-reductase